MCSTPKVVFDAFVKACVVALLAVSPAAADHNDSTPVGLRITVTNVDPFSGEVDFDITVVDDDITDGVASTNSRPFDDILIGQRFTYDRYDTVTYDQYVYVATNVSLPPAIDFGDGNTVPFSRLPLVSDITSDPGTFRGSFSHTYTTPGVFTITAFVAGAYGVLLTEITTGNPVSTGPLDFEMDNLAGTYGRSTDVGSDEAVYEIFQRLIAWLSAPIAVGTGVVAARHRIIVRNQQIDRLQRDVERAAEREVFDTSAARSCLVNCKRVDLLKSGVKEMPVGIRLGCVADGNVGALGDKTSGEKLLIAVIQGCPQQNRHFRIDTSGCAFGCQRQNRPAFNTVGSGKSLCELG